MQKILKTSLLLTATAIGALACIFVNAMILIWVYHKFLSPSPRLAGKYKPVINHQPKHFMTINGNIDPGIKNTPVVKITAVYSTTNHQCLYTSQFIPHYLDSRSVVKTMTLKTTNHHFSYKVPIDYFAHGYCGWKIDNISYSANNLQYMPLAFFTDQKVNQNDRVTNQIGCYQSLCQINRHDISFTNRLHFNRNKNYQFTLNIVHNKIR